MRKRTIVLLAALLLGVAGWWFLGRRVADPGTGLVRVEWSGSERGVARLPGRIAWCPVTRMATLRAISNDTGLLIALLEPDSMRTGPHQVVSPAIRSTSPRPNASAALRWVADTLEILGYASVSGMVEMSSVGEVVSGSMEIRFRRPTTLDTIVLRGDFRDVPVVAGAVGCT